ncbi:unnamed protein product [Sphenostylis stenocarpa]|uniref:Uncharacterized protein n=1 Tax=Sphenostylis stenocarpa TaxID=92480 RepID=A0AA86VVT5_9FABA|nr:unnamed protein product [Sphenostylis stenocarpa]
MRCHGPFGAPKFIGKRDRGGRPSALGGRPSAPNENLQTGVCPPTAPYGRPSALNGRPSAFFLLVICALKIPGGRAAPGE